MVLRIMARPAEAMGMSTRADCCNAKATYRVVLPLSARLGQPAELLLCGHHLRASRSALDARGAEIREMDELFAALGG
jgi:hypothetical protein